MSKKENRFNKNTLKFTVQIYEPSRKGSGHIVDIQLSQGHPLVFFPLSRRIYGELEN